MSGLQKKINHVPVIVRNPAYVADVELDEDEVNPVDLTPQVSGDDPIFTAPASEDEDVAEDVEDGRDDDEEMEEVPQLLQDIKSSLEELSKELITILSPAPRDSSSPQPPVVPRIEVWDTGRAWEREYRLYPESSIKEISDRLSSQVLDLLRIMHERINQQTWNEKDIELIDGLSNISVMHTRLSKLTEKVLSGQAWKPNQ